jgi:Mrp family chromosome partitioning ATPase/capsular polysaccharide biosynthesis protein
MEAAHLQPSDSPRLNDYLRPILGRAWLIIGIVVVVTAATYVYYHRQPPIYAASTQIYLGSDGDPLNNGVTSGTDRNIENQARLFSSAAVLSRVAKDVGYQGSPQGLLGSVAITPTKGSDLIGISARLGDPVKAAHLANAFADAFITAGKSSLQRQIAASIKGLRAQLRSIPNNPDNDETRLTLNGQLHQLQLAQETSSSTASQVGRATAPGAPVAPRPARNAIFAFALSLIAALGLAFGLERFDRRIKRVEDAAEFYDLPILTVVPHSDDIEHMANGMPSVSGNVKESFHQLRANLRLSSPDRPPRKILVTSGLPGEGKSTVVRNLAITFREWGQRVAVVDADLRNPSLNKIFNAESDRGLTDILTGDCALRDAMMLVSVEALGLGTLERIHANAGRAAVPARKLQRIDPAATTVTLIGPGPRPANPPAVLLAAATRNTFDEILQSHDIVLIDTPPLLAVSDTMSLLADVDAVILVTRLEVTTQDSARRTAEVIARVPGARVAGIVVNDLSGLAGMDYGYGYGYGAPYGSQK